MKTLCFHLTILALIYCVPLTGIAQDKNNKDLIFATDLWDGYVNNDGTGLLLELFQQLYQPEGYSVSIKVLPWLRIIQGLESGKIDSIIGTYSMKHMRGKLQLNFEGITPHYPIATSHLIALCNKGINFIQNTNSHYPIPNGRYAWIRGYFYDQLFDIPKQQTVNNTEQGVKMVQAKRLDCFIDGDDYISLIANKVNLNVNDYKKKPYAKRNLYPAFVNNKRGVKLASIFDEGMKDAIQNKTIFDIYKKWGQSYHKVKYQNPEDY